MPPGGPQFRRGTLADFGGIGRRREYVLTTTGTVASAEATPARLGTPANIGDRSAVLPLPYRLARFDPWSTRSPAFGITPPYCRGEDQIGHAVPVHVAKHDEEAATRFQAELAGKAAERIGADEGDGLIALGPAIGAEA